MAGRRGRRVPKVRKMPVRVIYSEPIRSRRPKGENSHVLTLVVNQTTSTAKGGGQHDAHPV